MKSLPPRNKGETPSEVGMSLSLPASAGTIHAITPFPLFWRSLMVDRIVFCVVLGLCVLALPNDAPAAECARQADGSFTCQAFRAVTVDVPGVSVDVGPGVSVDVRSGRVDVDIRRRPIVRRWFRPRVRVRIGLKIYRNR